MQVVFDTNVLVSASLFERSTPAHAFCRAVDAGDLLVSDVVLGELSVVLRREKFDCYVSLSTRERFLSTLVQTSLVIETTESIRASRDPDDDKFLELAVSGNADCIVSGDEDLLVLHPFRGIPILTPSAFLDWLSTHS